MDALTAGTSSLPEKPEDSKFLLDIPDDFDMEGACLRLQDMVKDPISKYNAGLVAAIKIVLNLKFSDARSDMKASIVLLNSINEAAQLCGYISPETILMFLKVRREKIKELLGSAPLAE